MHGLGGNDTIYTGSGNDIVYAGDGNDRVFTGAGDDRVYGGPGNDYLNGGSGNDQLFGGAGNEVLVGGDGRDVLHGDAGRDSLRGTPGEDTLYGGGGNDNLKGGSGADALYGGSGNDDLNGGEGDNQCSGGDGANIESPSCDSTPPRLVSLNLSQTSFDTSQASVQITATAHITDDMTGLGDAAVFFGPGRAVMFDFRASDRVSGTALDGVYQGPPPFPATSPRATGRSPPASATTAHGSRIPARSPRPTSPPRGCHPRSPSWGPATTRRRNSRR